MKARRRNTAPPRPVRDDFPDYPTYHEALLDWTEEHGSFGEWLDAVVEMPTDADDLADVIAEACARWEEIHALPYHCPKETD